jgi:hypothetical protein
MIKIFENAGKLFKKAKSLRENEKWTFINVQNRKVQIFSQKK